MASVSETAGAADPAAVYGAVYVDPYPTTATSTWIGILCVDPCPAYDWPGHGDMPNCRHCGGPILTTSGGWIHAAGDSP